MRRVAPVVALLLAFVAGCSEKPASTTEINLRVDATGQIWLQEQQLQLPALHASLEAMLGTPSRTKNYTVFDVPFTNHVWDDLGIMTVNSASGRVEKINFALFGDLEDQDISPRSRFIGSIQLPSGVLVFDDYVETGNLGFENFMGEANILVQYMGGVELMVVGGEMGLGRPVFAHLAF